MIKHKNYKTIFYTQHNQFYYSTQLHHHQYSLLQLNGLLNANLSVFETNKTMERHICSKSVFLIDIIYQLITNIY